MHSGGSLALYGDVYGSPNKSLEQTFWRNSGGAVKSKPATPEMNNCNATIGESVQVHHSRRLHLPEFRLMWGSYSSGQLPCRHAPRNNLHIRGCTQPYLPA